MTAAKLLRSASCALAVACLAWSATTAHAISISVTSLATLAGNTADNADTSPPVAENRSATSILNSGTTTPDAVLAQVTAGTRYASVVTADSDAFNFASITRNATASYRVVFTITPDNVGTIYDVEFDTRRLGALINRDEGGAAGQADISAVTGTLNNVADAGLGLADPGSINTNSTQVIAINQSNSLVLAGLSGVQVFQLDFTWTASAGSGNNVLSGGDEGAVMLGLVGSVSQVGAADDYPGTSGRATGATTDGHFVDVTVTVVQVVPEPGTFVMAGLGALCLGFAVSRKRRS